MPLRDEHTFQFSANKIASAADQEMRYHLKRSEYWTNEYKTALQRVRETAKIEVREYEITGGVRPDVCVSYGDPAAYKRMTEAHAKIQQHNEQAERFKVDAALYASQGDRTYELGAEDVRHFRLAGQKRPD